MKNKIQDGGVLISVLVFAYAFFSISFFSISLFSFLSIFHFIHLDYFGLVFSVFISWSLCSVCLFILIYSVNPIYTLIYTYDSFKDYLKKGIVYIKEILKNRSREKRSATQLFITRTIPKKSGVNRGLPNEQHG